MRFDSSWQALVFGAHAWLLVGFGWLVWHADRRQGSRGVMALCLLLAVVIGYTDFRYICSQPLTCDVGGPEAARYYLTHVFPSRALLHLLTLAGAATVVLWRKRRAAERFTIGDGAIAAGGVLGSWIASSLLLDALGLLSF